MPGAPEIRRLETRDDFVAAYPLMHQLRTDLNLEQYLELLDEMVADGYEMWGLSAEGGFRALAGIASRTNFYYRRFIYVYDLITDQSTRSRGFGAALLGHIEELARKRGQDVIALSSGVQRTDAHRFYEKKMGYERPSYVFRKTLK